MNRGASLTAACALAACTASSPQRSATVQPPPGPLPADAQQAFQLATTRAAAFQQVSAVAVAKGLTGLPGLTVVVDLLAQRPAHLFVAARGFFGPPTDEVWTDGESFLWRSNRPGASGARGPATPQAMGALLPVALPPSQWVGLLLGLPLPEGDPLTVASCPDPPNARCVLLAYPEGSVTLWVGSAGTVIQASLEQNGDLAQVRYGPPDERLGIPTQLSLSARRGATKASLVLQDVRINGAPPPPSLFAPLHATP